MQAYFATQQPDERFMSYSQLRRYTEQLESSGFREILKKLKPSTWLSLIMVLWGEF